MNPFFQRIIIDTVLRNKKKQKPEKTRYSPYEIAKAYQEFKISVVDFFRDVVFISLGILSASFGLRGFLIPNDFIDGYSSKFFKSCWNIVKKDVVNAAQEFFAQDQLFLPFNQTVVTLVPNIFKRL